ncbi:MAG TPA: UDP-N-acetylmuramoyl-tripeptide--D-alanyl-D-alanine ligase [Jiangellaceae bacterium]
MIPLTLAEIAEAVGGTLDGGADPAATVTAAVVVDSRLVEPCGLFVARVGEEQDGHDYAGAAVEAGAAAVLAQRPVGVPAIVVADSERAFGLLARAVVDRLPKLTVVGVTGSSGKTSTKDLLAQVLEPLGPLVAPPGSFNTEVGVPLTVLRADESTRTLVVEMGARGVGHIAYLCDIAPPTIGVVLNVGSAHLGEFGDRDTTARAKAELVEALPAHGTAVLNGDDQLVRAMAEKTEATVLMVGESVHADIRAEDVSLDDHGHPAFELVTPEGRAPVRLTLVGEHHVGNALAAAGAAHALGMSAADIAARLEQAQARSRWRMEVTERADGVTVVNDAYNANPESMRAALKALAALGRGRRIWAVLGQMLELGDSSTAEHDALGRLAVRLDVSRLVAVGEGARPIQLGAAHEGSWGDEASWVPDADAALAILRAELRSGDVVLVKASRATGLERLAEALVGEDPQT